jgi:hypothetical protein
MCLRFRRSGLPKAGKPQRLTTLVSVGLTAEVIAPEIASALRTGLGLILIVNHCSGAGYIDFSHATGADLEVAFGPPDVLNSPRLRNRGGSPHYR